jgi:hypothetical protein
MTADTPTLPDEASGGEEKGRPLQHSGGLYDASPFNSAMYNQPPIIFDRPDRAIDGDGIFVDAAQPATLHDGPAHTDCPTLQEAVLVWHRLLPERQRFATISSGGEVYSAGEINRLHYGPRPDASRLSDATRAAADQLFWGTQSDTVAAAQIANSQNRGPNPAILSTLDSVVPPLPPTPESVEIERDGVRAEARIEADGGLTATAEVRRANGARIRASLIANSDAIVINVEAALLLIDERIASLDRRNSAEARDELEQYQNLRQALGKFRDTAHAFLLHEISEADAVEESLSFVQGIRAWWHQRHVAICDSAFNSALFLSLLGICKICGAEGEASTIVAGALVGGKTVADALGAAAKLIQK